ncbi:hypothetical protein B0O80DRAFT_519805, partial [Mortierella sp. GBAus27b]
ALVARLHSSHSFFFLQLIPPSCNPFPSWTQDNTHKSSQPQPHPLARCPTAAQAQAAEFQTVTSNPKPRTFPGGRSRSANKAPGFSRSATHSNELGLDLKSNTGDIMTLLSRSPKLPSLALNDPRNYGLLRLINSERLGTLLENVGPMHIYLRSTINHESKMIERAFQKVTTALEKATSLHQLDIEIERMTSRENLEILRGLLTNTNMGALKFRMDFSMLSYENSSRGKLHDSIFDIMRHPLTHSIAIRGIPEDFIRQSSLLKKNDGFPSLRHMEIDLTELKEDILGIKCLISNAPDLSSLIIQGEIDDSSLLRLYMAIAEHQTCSITFVSRSLDIPPLATTPNQPFASQYATHLFNVAGEKINTHVLAGEWYEEAIVDTFARPETIGAGLRELYIKSDSMERGDQFIRDVASVVSRFDLDKLVIELRGVKRRMQILESIPWKRIRHLKIDMNLETVGTCVCDEGVSRRGEHGGWIGRVGILRDQLFLC